MVEGLYILVLGILIYIDWSQEIVDGEEKNNTNNTPTQGDIKKKLY